MTQSNLSPSLFFFIKKNIVYSLAIIFERSIVFLLLPLYTYVLLPAEYGIYAVLLSFISLAVFLYTMGIENGLLKYSAETSDRTLLNSTTFWGMIVLAAFFSSLILLFSGNVSSILLKQKDYSPFVKIAAGILFFDTVTRFFIYAIVGEQKSKIYLSISILGGCLTILLNVYLLLFLHLGLRGVFFCHLFSSGIIALIVLIASIRRIQLRFDLKILKKIFLFGYPVMFTSISLVMLNFFDRYLLQVFTTTAEVGKYSAAYKIGMMMNVIVSAFSTGALPFISHVLKDNKNEQELFSKLLSLLFCVMISVFTFLSFFTNEIVRIRIFGYYLINSKYLDTINLVPIILLSYIFYGFYINFSLGIYHKEKTKVLSVITFIGFLINLGLNLILIPPYSSAGAAFATLISFLTMTIIMFFYTKKLLPIKYDWKNISGLFFLSLFLYMLATILFNDILFKICAYFLFQLLVLYYGIKSKVFVL